MNILQIFPGKVWGGAEQYVVDLGAALVEKGHNVSYLACNSKAVLQRLSGELQVSTLPFACALDIYSIVKLGGIIKSGKIDIVHIHDVRFVPIAVLAKRMSGCSVKVILTRHIARASRTNILYRGLFKELHSIIFVSDLAKRMWYSVNGWMPQDKCKVVHNSIPDLADDFTEDLRARYNIPEHTPLIIFTGRVRKSKGCAVIVEALARIKHLPYFMLFIGTCKPKDYGNELIALAKKHGIADRVALYGFSNKTRCLIKCADIGVAPSIVKEALGLSPMEFMQAGKAVIATNNGAQPEYILSGKTGFLVAPDSVQELSDALKRLLESESLREQTGSAAQEYFNKELNYNKFIENILGVYQN